MAYRNIANSIISSVNCLLEEQDQKAFDSVLLKSENTKSKRIISECRCKIVLRLLYFQDAIGIKNTFTIEELIFSHPLTEKFLLYHLQVV